jgi:hypothetical protein
MRDPDRITISGVAAVLLTAAMHCAATEPAVPAPDDDSTDMPPALARKFEPYHEKITTWIKTRARGIDSWFGTDETWLVDNDSYLRVTDDMRWDQRDQFSNRLRTRLKLDLPTSSKRLRLLIENDEPEQRTATEEALPSLRKTTGSESGNTVFGIGTPDLGGWAKDWEKKLQGGVRIRLPLDPYARFIAKRSWDLDGDWDLSSYNRLAWFNSDGWSVNSQINIGEPLSPRRRLQFTTDFTWREDRDYLQFAQSVNVAQVLTRRSAVNYSAGAIGTGLRGPKFTAYFLAADYRRNLHRQVLFFDVIPELTFPRDEGFDPHWAITLRLELYFRGEVVEP